MSELAFKLVVNSQVIPCDGWDDLADTLARAYLKPGATAATARLCTSLTRDRPLTADEQQKLVDLTAKRIAEINGAT